MNTPIDIHGLHKSFGPTHALDGLALQGDLPPWLVEASPYTHVPLVPSQPPAWAPLLWLTAVFVVSITFGITKSSKRDIA